jgi:hypothetical protein
MGRLPCQPVELSFVPFGPTSVAGLVQRGRDWGGPS